MSLPVHTVEEVRAAESLLLARLPDGALMQRAAFGLAVEVAGLLARRRGRVTGARVVVVAGAGNNGGDGIYAGVELARRGAQVTVCRVASSLHEGARRALEAAGGTVVAAGTPQAGAAIAAADLVVDAVIGIGGSGGLRAPAAAAFADISAPVVAVDLPSGVDANTGAVPGDAVRADLTVTFGSLKPGLLLAPGCERTGDVALVDIGLAEVLPEPSVRTLEATDVARWLPRPAAADYKYSRGIATLVVGSAEYPGAALLAAAGARASDVGMVQLVGPASAAVASRYPDVVFGSPRERATTVAAGCGLGRDEGAAAALSAVITTSVPLLLDADALHILDRVALRERAAANLITVLTPHEGEFRALGFDPAGDRLTAARAAARELGCVVVLKGPGTVIAAPTGAAYIDTAGTSALATAGTGDVLAGLGAGLLASAAARGAVHSVDDAAACMAAAVWLHGHAGRAASAEGAVRATDVAAMLPECVARLRSPSEHAPDRSDL